MSTATAGARPFQLLALWAGLAALALLLAVAGYHVVNVLLDYRAALSYPLQLDYGEGIVWQQALLMFTHRAYSASQALPFIVFHYPPVYYLVTRAVALLQPDMLIGGRLVSMAATLLCAPLIAALVLTTVRRPVTAAQVTAAIGCGLVVICLHAVRNWAVLMRVDMLAVAIGLLGLWLGIRARGRFAPTTMALLVCVAAVFTKQTQLPAGIAVFVVALICNPRGAIGAALVAGGIGGAIVLALQWATGGGFLLNIIGYNINPFALHKVWDALAGERTSAPLALAMLAGALTVLVGFRHGGLRLLRSADPVWVARGMILVHTALTLLLLVNLAKEGSSYNYFIDSLAIGCVLIGVALCGFGLGSLRFAGLALFTALGVAYLPLRQLDPDLLAARAAELQPIVAEIAAATKPVASEDMTLVMRAGKSLWYEPAIIHALIAAGRWDPTPLVEMIREKGFAFIVTFGSGDDMMGREQVVRAVQQAYPDVREEAPQRFVRRPAP